MSVYDYFNGEVSARPGDAGWLAVFVYRTERQRYPIVNVYLHDTQGQARSHIARAQRGLSDEGARGDLQAYARPLLTSEMFGTLPEPGGGAPMDGRGI